MAVSSLTILAGLGLASPSNPSTVQHPCLGFTARAPVVRCLRAGSSGLRRSSAGRALVRARMGARARVGLAAWGAGRPVGPDVRGACLRKGQLFGAGVFGGSGSSFIIS